MERIDALRPYLSVVATSRNDDHGKNLLQRMQIFVTGFIEQCRRFNLPAELIIVEWNPPADRPPLVEALNWPVEDSPVTVRIITVPPETHRRFKHAEALPVFQMIAKNVGIRRAKGEFILATNIDLLFSDALFEFLANRRLRKGVMYRINRSDAPATVPLQASIQDQLAYCATHVIRENARLSAITLPQPQPYEYTFSTAERLVSILPPSLLRLYCSLYEGPVGKSLGWLAPRYRVRTLIDQPSAATAHDDPSGVAHVLTGNMSDRALRPQSWWHALKHQLPNTVKHRVKMVITAPGRIVKQMLPNDLKHRMKMALGRALQAGRLAHLYKVAQLPHLNACGDFTLMAREHWFALHGYPEDDIFSMHLDSLLCTAAWFGGLREVVLRPPMRVFHIEHATGSGYTPEGWAVLVQRLEAQGIRHLRYEEFLAVARAMRGNSQRAVFNDESWGLVCDEFQETVLCA